MMASTKTLLLTSNIFKNIFNKNNLIYFRAISSAANPSDDIIFEDINNAGVITLNRPKALNSITESLLSKLIPKLKQWEHEKSLVLIKGAGETAFSSGGDVKALTEGYRKGERLGHNLFRLEYTANGIIGNYSTPYVALIDGIVMGGGVGLSIHGHYRICTERTLYAMPETAIGLIPDVGSSYVLPRMPNKLGFYLGLSGARLKGTDVLNSGIATHFIESSKLKELEQEILKCKDHKGIKDVLNKMCPPPGKEFSLKPHLEKIEKCFSKNTMEEIMTELENDGSEFAKNTLKLLNHMSPTSMKVALKALQIGGRKSNLFECLQMEYRIAYACLAKHDFYEGVRALLIDKDKNPKWNPKTLQEVPDSFVDSYFTKLPENEELQI